jgi:hypothetical protein
MGKSERRRKESGKKMRRDKDGIEGIGERQERQKIGNVK